MRKGALVIYLYYNWSDLRNVIASWARTIMYIGGAYLFFTNTSAFFMMMMLLSFAREAANSTASSRTIFG